MRKPISRKIEAEVLIRCRRRCAVCFGLHLDISIKRGQIAHLDQDASNNSSDNLVFLCFDHHDEYDSKTRQSKGLTQAEVRHFQSELLADISRTWRESNPFNITPLIDIKGYSGHYVWDTPNATAELDIRAIGPEEIEVSGIALWGTQNPSGPNIGQIDFSQRVVRNQILYIDRQSGYEMDISFTEKGLVVDERSNRSLFGRNVSFAGEFRKVDEMIQKEQYQLIPDNSKVFVRNGNIILKHGGREKQLTFWGLDKSPFMIRDGHVLLIRQEEAVSADGGKVVPARKYYTHQLILVDIKTTFERIVTDTKPYEDGNDGTTKILSIRSPALSSDERFLYFVTEKYVTASQLVKVNIDTGVWTELFSAESFELMSDQSGRHLFLIAQSEIRNKGRDIYYKLCDEPGKVLKEFDTQESMLKFKTEQTSKH
jgi:hypothetical protein